MDVGMPCGLFGRSRSGGGFFGSHMSILTLRLHVQNAHGTGQNLHGLTGQQEVGRGWLWGRIVHEAVYPGLWRGPDIAVVHSQPKRIEIVARILPSVSGEPRRVL